MLSGAEFLRHSNLGVQTIPGKRVGVMGGGNVAIDVARSLLRLGAEPVIIYRRTRTEMPALAEEIEKAEEEGIRIEFLALPVEVSKKDGKVYLKCTRMELGPPDETGRPRPVPIKGSEFTMDFDAVMKAIGEEPDTSILSPELLDKRGQLKTNGAEYHLANNIFSGGDFITGPSTVVAAIAAGRKAADSIHQYLRGAVEPSEIPNCSCSESVQRFNSEFLWKTNRAVVPEIPIAERKQSLYIEEVKSLDPKIAMFEANRCFNCGCVAVNSSDIAPSLIVLNAKIQTTKRFVEAEEFFSIGINRTTVLDDDELVLEIDIPLSLDNTRSSYIKFALRKSIDFPIVNCAAVITMEKDLVQSARICLNSVFNLPYRVNSAERYITGKSINESTAEAAADTFIKDTLPLVNNRYKIQIARTLVKRAILACNPNYHVNK